jgi:hypothetical protein
LVISLPHKTFCFTFHDFFHVFPKAILAAKEKRSGFSIGVVARIAMFMPTQYYIHRDGFQWNIFTTALYTLDYLHHRATE